MIRYSACHMSWQMPHGYKMLSVSKNSRRLYLKPQRPEHLLYRASVFSHVIGINYLRVDGTIRSLQNLSKQNTYVLSCIIWHYLWCQNKTIFIQNWEQRTTKSKLVVVNKLSRSKMLNLPIFYLAELRCTWRSCRYDQCATLPLWFCEENSSVQGIVYALRGVFPTIRLWDHE